MRLIETELQRFHVASTLGRAAHTAKLRGFTFLATTVGAVMLAGCSAPAVSTTAGATTDVEMEENLGRVEGAIVDVEQTAVKNQSIGNCWIYAAASWAESLHKSATGIETNISESYWTYWHWFDQIVGQRVSEVSTGGWWRTAVNIAWSYGIMEEGDFIPGEANEMTSATQASALDVINESLKSGALSTAAARADRALVRAELDRAWGLDASVRGHLDAVFGETVRRNLANQRALPAGAAAAPIKTVWQYAVKVPNPSAVARTWLPLTQERDFVTVQLGDLINSRSPYAWRELRYGWGSGRRSVQQRFQKALHDRQPVVMSWYVDFNFRSPDRSRFILPDPLPEPGSQGGHVVVMEDYQIDTGASFGVLQAGVTLDPANAADQQKFLAALQPQARMEFIRIKNSWGTRSEPAEGFNGYHDLTMEYLNAEIPVSCGDASDPEWCRQNPTTRSGFTDVVLPAGY
jgi:hypothetical protein